MVFILLTGKCVIVAKNISSKDGKDYPKAILSDGSNILQFECAMSAYDSIVLGEECRVVLDVSSFISPKGMYTRYVIVDVSSLKKT